MTTLREGNLQIAFPQGVKVRKFDDPKSHGLSHCMKAVDIVVEECGRILFMEFKDPEHPCSKKGNRKEFVEDFISGRLDEALKYKYRDSFLYQWAAGNIDTRKIYYCVLVAIDNLTSAELGIQTDDLKRKLPLKGLPAGIWKQQIAEGCAVFNIPAWNKHLPHYPVTRISAGR